MKHYHWNPDSHESNPTEEVADSTPQGLLDEFDIPPTPLEPFWLPLDDERATVILWQLRLPVSKKADPVMLTIALRHGMTLDHTDKS